MKTAAHTAIFWRVDLLLVIPYPGVGLRICRHCSHRNSIRARSVVGKGAFQMMELRTSLGRPPFCIIEEFTYLVNGCTTQRFAI